MWWVRVHNNEQYERRFPSLAFDIVSFVCLKQHSVRFVKGSRSQNSPHDTTLWKKERREDNALFVFGYPDRFQRSSDFFCQNDLCNDFLLQPYSHQKKKPCCVYVRVCCTPRNNRGSENKKRVRNFFVACSKCNFFLNLRWFSPGIHHCRGTHPTRNLNSCKQNFLNRLRSNRSSNFETQKQLQQKASKQPLSARELSADFEFDQLKSSSFFAFLPGPEHNKFTVSFSF